MVDAIYSALLSIGGFFVSIGELIFDLIDGVLYVVDIVLGAFAQLPFYFSWMPGIVGVGLLAILTVVLVLRIMEYL